LADGRDFYGAYRSERRDLRRSRQAQRTEPDYGSADHRGPSETSHIHFLPFDFLVFVF
jgi:hypothetical protein